MPTRQHPSFFGPARRCTSRPALIGPGPDGSDPATGPTATFTFVIAT